MEHSMKPIKKAVTTTGKYTDRSGNEKNQYLTIGKLLQRDDGSTCLKIDAIPVNFSGWVNFYDLDENRAENNANGMAQAKAALEPTGGDNYSGDIPFSNYELKGWA